MSTDTKQRESFVFYREWYDVISKRDDKTRLEIYDAIMGKVFGVDVSIPSELASVVIDLIIGQIERDNQKRLDISEKRRLAGKKHWVIQNNKTEQKETNENKTEQKETNDDGIINIDINNNTKNEDDNKDDVTLFEQEEKEEKKENIDKSIFEKKTKKFIPPTRHEVEAYIKEKGYHFDAQAFIDYYEADDWHYGKGSKRTKVTNWKRCCSAWEGNSLSTRKNTIVLGDEDMDIEERIRNYYDTLSYEEQAKILQLDPYQYRMLSDKGKEYWRNVRRQLMVDWIKAQG